MHTTPILEQITEMPKIIIILCVHLDNSVILTFHAKEKATATCTLVPVRVAGKLSACGAITKSENFYISRFFYVSLGKVNTTTPL